MIKPISDFWFLTWGNPVVDRKWSSHMRTFSYILRHPQIAAELIKTNLKNLNKHLIDRTCKWWTRTYSFFFTSSLLLLLDIRIISEAQTRVQGSHYFRNIFCHESILLCFRKKLLMKNLRELTIIYCEYQTVNSAKHDLFNSKM